MFLLLVRVINGDFSKGGAACMMPSSIEKICNLFKNGNVQEKYLLSL